MLLITDTVNHDLVFFKIFEYPEINLKTASTEPVLSTATYLIYCYNFTCRFLSVKEVCKPDFSCRCPHDSSLGAPGFLKIHKILNLILQKLQDTNHVLQKFTAMLSLNYQFVKILSFCFL